jgi:hypothetical protein
MKFTHTGICICVINTSIDDPNVQLADRSRPPAPIQIRFGIKKLLSRRLEPFVLAQIVYVRIWS